MNSTKSPDAVQQCSAKWVSVGWRFLTVMLHSSLTQISDDLEIAVVNDLSLAEPAIQAISAGVDILLMGNPKDWERM